jgi:hypothetical protein
MKLRKIVGSCLLIINSLYFSQFAAWSSVPYTKEGINITEVKKRLKSWESLKSQQKIEQNLDLSLLQLQESLKIDSFDINACCRDKNINCRLEIKQICHERLEAVNFVKNAMNNGILLDLGVNLNEDKYAELKKEMFKSFENKNQLNALQYLKQAELRSSKPSLYKKVVDVLSEEDINELVRLLKACNSIYGILYGRSILSYLL